MSIFRRPDYQSDITHFIQQLRQQQPQLQAQQRAGRALLWDAQVDRQSQAEFQAAKLAQPAYVYQTQ